jgi:hypothetical protein
MVSSEQTTESNSHQEIGRVVIIYDNAKAISADGTERFLTGNSPIFAYDRIITENDGKVSIVIDDDNHTQIDLDGTSDVIIDEDIFGGAGSEEIAAASAQIEQVHEAILIHDIDLTTEPETGSATDSLASPDEGRQLADSDRINHGAEIFNSAGEKISIVFDHSDYTDLDHGNPGAALDSLLNTDDPDSNS